MQNAPTRTVFDVITAFLATEPSPQEIINYFLPEDLQARADYLADRNGEDLLAPEEREELASSCGQIRCFRCSKPR